MKRFIDFATEDGIAIRVEVDEPEIRGTVPAGRGNVPEVAQQKFEDALARVVPVTKKVMEKLHGLANAPDEIEIAFGFSLSAEVGVVISSSSASANFGVVMHWTKENR
jgi:Trypsin-co-occurring domain 1